MVAIKTSGASRKHYTENNLKVVDFESYKHAIEFCLFVWSTDDIKYMIVNRKKSDGTGLYKTTPKFPTALGEYAYDWLNYRFIFSEKNQKIKKDIIVDFMSWSDEEMSQRLRDLYAGRIEIMDIVPLLTTDVTYITSISSEQVASSIRLYIFTQVLNESILLQVKRICDEYVAPNSVKFMYINKKTIIISCENTDDAQKILIDDKNIFKTKIKLSQNNFTYQVSSTSPIDQIKLLSSDIDSKLKNVNLNTITTTVKFQMPTISDEEVLIKPFFTHCLADDILNTLKSLNKSDRFTVLTFRYSPSTVLVEGIQSALNRGVTVTILIDEMKEMSSADKCKLATLLRTHGHLDLKVLMTSSVEGLQIMKMWHFKIYMFEKSNGSVVVSVGSANFAGRSLGCAGCKANVESLITLFEHQIPSFRNWCCCIIKHFSSEVTLPFLGSNAPLEDINIYTSTTCTSTNSENEVIAEKIGTCISTTSENQIANDNEVDNSSIPNEEDDEEDLYFSNDGEEFNLETEDARMTMEQEEFDQASVDARTRIVEELNSYVDECRSADIYLFHQPGLLNSSSVLKRSGKNAKDFLDFIKLAKRSIYFVTMSMTSPLSEAVIDAHCRGLQVFVVISHVGTEAVVKYLREHGVVVHVVYKCLMHVKGVLVDSSILFLGCPNLTIHALIKNGGEFLVKFMSKKDPETNDEVLSNNNISATLYFFQVMVKSAYERISNQMDSNESDDSDDDNRRLSDE